MKSVEERLFEIEERNQTVEFDKAWETSWTRRVVLLIITYAVVAMFLSRVHPENMWLDALVPCAGYLLSTLSLPPLKKYWIDKQLVNGDNEDLENDNV
ncbi:MAG: hypothetical protein PHD48_02495 [Alphaproteobacteria bacterium]|nr:hypothetical protein [Alphaproteobacteria bacterium]